MQGKPCCLQLPTLSIVAHQLKPGSKPDTSKTLSTGKSEALHISIYTYATCGMHMVTALALLVWSFEKHCVVMQSLG